MPWLKQSKKYTSKNSNRALEVPCLFWPFSETTKETKDGDKNYTTIQHLVLFFNTIKYELTNGMLTRANFLLQIWRS